MRVSGAYFYVYALAAFFLGFSIVVARDPAAFAERIRPLARDGAVVFERIEPGVRDFRSRFMDDDTAETLADTFRLPGALLNRVEKAVSEVRKELAQPSEFEPPEDTASSSGPEQAEI
jgi:hypothetical protein